MESTDALAASLSEIIVNTTDKIERGQHNNMNGWPFMPAPFSSLLISQPLTLGETLQEPKAGLKTGGKYHTLGLNGTAHLKHRVVEI